MYSIIYFIFIALLSGYIYVFICLFKIVACYFKVKAIVNNTEHKDFLYHYLNKEASDFLGYFPVPNFFVNFFNQLGNLLDEKRIAVENCISEREKYVKRFWVVFLLLMMMVASLPYI